MVSVGGGVALGLMLRVARSPQSHQSLCASGSIETAITFLTPYAVTICWVNTSEPFRRAGHGDDRPLCKLAPQS